MSVTQRLDNSVRKASFLTVAWLLLAGWPCGAQTSQAAVPEYRLKTAYIYKILPFVHWPDPSEDQENLVVGVFGEKAHEAARELVDGKIVKSKNEPPRMIRVTRLFGRDVAGIESTADYPALHACQVVFISASCTVPASQVLDLVQDRSVLTFGESSRFLDAGGIINFVAEDKKVRFEVNLETARRAKLKIDSQLLRLAKRVIKKK